MVESAALSSCSVFEHGRYHENVSEELAVLRDAAAVLRHKTRASYMSTIQLEQEIYPHVCGFNSVVSEIQAAVFVVNSLHKKKEMTACVKSNLSFIHLHFLFDTNNRHIPINT